MYFLPFDRMWERIEIARDDSDMALFMNLMYMGELLTKVVAAGLTAALVDDKQRSRYQIVYRLVRANGLGEWTQSIDEILTGPASQFLYNLALEEKVQLIKATRQGDWQYEAVSLMHSCLTSYNLNISPLSTKLDGRKWFSLFTHFRNKTRAHGAPQSGTCGLICSTLEKSISAVLDNFILFKRSWVYLHRNLSGKYRVTKITPYSEPFEYLKKSSPKAHLNLEDGVYIHFDQHAFVELVESDQDVYDFYIFNGQFTQKKFELISYITDNKKDGDSSKYQKPATDLPDSETQGRGILDIQGNTFGNLPPVQEGYIHRSLLEKELNEIIRDDRHPLITLIGRGGIGKTWLALSILHKIAEEGSFGAIIWFSARDIDLLPYGPKQVKPHVLDEFDTAEEFVRLLDPKESYAEGFRKVDFLSEYLGKSRIGPILFVFDNFG